MSKFYKYLFILIFNFFLYDSQAQIYFDDPGFGSPSFPPNTIFNGSNGEQNINLSNSYQFKIRWDTSFGGFWSRDFAFSNMKDTVTGDYTNLYSSIYSFPFGGYLVATQNWEGGARIYRHSMIQTDTYIDWFLVNNTTYAYKSMKNGDAFAKKFGGLSGNDPDFFLLNIIGWQNGILINDTIQFYLADYRFADNSQDYIINDWTAVNVGFVDIGFADSLELFLTSSDTGAFGMNTPAFFCLDEFSTNLQGSIEKSEQTSFTIFPNPAENALQIQIKNLAILPESIRIYNLNGQMIWNQPIQNNTNLSFDISALSPGMYMLEIESKQGKSRQKLIKK